MPCAIVERMAIFDEDFGTDLTLAEGGSGAWSGAPARQPRDWRSRYEQEHARAERERARADAAQARCEELRWAEVASRSDAGSWKSRFKACRRKLSEAVEETKEARRAARDVPSLQAEVARLETLLCEAGIESSESRRVEALRKEVARLRKALATPEAPEGAISPRPVETRRRRTTTLERSPGQKDTIRTLRKEVTRLNKEVVRRDKEIARLNKRLDQEKERSESLRETGRKLSRESLRLHREVRILGECEARARSLSDEVYRLRFALEVSHAGNDKLKARLVKLRAVGATRSKLPCDEAAQLRAALRRSRRQKTTVNVLRKENARLRKAAQGAAEIATPEGDDQVPFPGERPAAQGCEDVAEPNRDAGGPACEASRDRGVAVEGALRAQERAAGDAALGASARPAARRARPWPYPTARARGAHRRAQPAGRCVRLRTVRTALCAERRRGIQPHRDRGPGPQARDPPSALAPDLRLRVVAHGSVGAAGAAAVRQNALRDRECRADYAVRQSRTTYRQAEAHQPAPRRGWSMTAGASTSCRRATGASPSDRGCPYCASR